MRKGLCGSCYGAAFFLGWRVLIPLCAFSWMGRHWSIAVSRRLTFSLVISSQLDFTLKRQERRLGWFWALQQPFSPMENNLGICADYISLSLFFFSFVLPFWFWMSLLDIFRGKHLFCWRHEARQLLLTLGKGGDVTLSGVILRCWWIGWQIQTVRLVSPRKSITWKVN